MERLFFGLGAALAAIGVMTGAFAAHGLEGRLSADNLDTWQTAARYHIFHAIGLLAVAWAAERWGGGLTIAAGWLLIAGILLFSGSLYVLAVSGIRILGAVAPLGGLAFILGWGCLVAAAVRG